MKKKVIIAVCVVIVLVLGISLLHSVLEPRFAGYYGKQPKLKVFLLPQSNGASQVSPVCDAAKAFMGTVNHGKRKYWPEPSTVSERSKVWWVGFKQKEEVFIVMGVRTIRKTVPGGMTVEVDKNTLLCRYVPGR